MVNATRLMQCLTLTILLAGIAPSPAYGMDWTCDLHERYVQKTKPSQPTGWTYGPDYAFRNGYRYRNAANRPGRERQPVHQVYRDGQYVTVREGAWQYERIGPNE